MCGGPPLDDLSKSGLSVKLPGKALFAVTALRVGQVRGGAWSTSEALQGVRMGALNLLLCWGHIPQE